MNPVITIFVCISHPLLTRRLVGPMFMQVVTWPPGVLVACRTNGRRSLVCRHSSDLAPNTGTYTPLAPSSCLPCRLLDLLSLPNCLPSHTVAVSVYCAAYRRFRPPHRPPMPLPFPFPLSLPLSLPSTEPSAVAISFHTVGRQLGEPWVQNETQRNDRPSTFRSVVSVRINDLLRETPFHDSTEELTGQRVRELVAIGVRGQWGGGRFFKDNVADL